MLDHLLASNPISYDFISTSEGWAVEHGGTSEAPSPDYRVFRTVDGGDHWQQQVVGVGSSIGLDQISISLFPGNQGFLVLGRPVEAGYRTSDGGAHWEPVALPDPEVDSVVFGGATEGWLVASIRAGATRAFVTSDAGATWRRQADLPIGSFGLELRGVYWLGSSNGPPSVHMSPDGSGWTTRPIPYPPSAGAAWPVAPWTANIILLPVAGVLSLVSCACATNQVFTYTSFDQGLTWNPIDAPPGYPAFSTDMDWVGDKRWRVVSVA